MSRKLDGLKIAQEIAEKRGGMCLSKTYKNIITKMLFICKLKHKWEAPLGRIMKNHWCRKCADVVNANNYKLDGIKIAQEIAKSHGGKCLSTEYKNTHIKLHWECKELHRWWACLGHVKNSNSWCPECSFLEAAKKLNNSYILYHWKTGRELVCVASYEKAVVEYFNANKINFRWQSKTFILPDGKHTFRPDLYLFSTKKWIEIKGFFRDDAEEKWNWFHKEHPNSELWDKTKLKSLGIL